MSDGRRAVAGKYTCRGEVIEDVGELEGAVADGDGGGEVWVGVGHMGYLGRLSLPRGGWVPPHHLRPCLPSQRC